MRVKDARKRADGTLQRVRDTGPRCTPRFLLDTKDPGQTTAAAGSLQPVDVDRWNNGYRA
jgi:hypothetical protein